MNIPPFAPVLGTAAFHLLLLNRPKDHSLFAFSKCLPIWILSQQSLNVWMKRGLLLSSIGDALLAYQDTHPTFLPGLASFFISQVFYAKGLYGPPSASSVNLGIFSYGLTGLLLGTAIIPNTPLNLRIPVGIYGTAIATLLWNSLDMFVTTGATHGMFGAILFAVSDFCLAYDRFVKPIPFGNYLIMSTYYAAQYFLAQVV